VYTYAASGEVTSQQLDTAWPCTNLWSGVGILFSPVFSGAFCYLDIAETPEDCHLYNRCHD